MKIYIITSLNPYFVDSAAANRWRTIIEGLTKLDVQIELLLIKGYNSFHEIKIRKTQFHNIKIRHIGFLYYGNMWMSKINKIVLSHLIFPIVKYKIKKIAYSNKQNIYWTDCDIESLQIAVELKKNIPSIINIVEINEFLDIHYYNNSKPQQIKLGDIRMKYFEKVAIHSYKGIIFMTEILQKHFQRYIISNQKQIHLPMTVDLERFENCTDTLDEFNKPYIAYVGVLNNAKDGVDILIKAFSKIQDRFPSYKLYLVGQWHYDTPIQLNLIENLGLKNKVVLPGFHTRDSITKIINNATLLVLPRPNSKQAEGGFPMKLGEYLASGNPVCATKVGEIPNYLIDNESVFFAEPNSVESFAQAMERALSDLNIAKKVGLEGRKVANSSFNMNIQSKNLYNFLLSFNDKNTENNV